jgi:deazaflavin-dependent oxidoreductase (nitroreductase family)
MEIRRRIVRFNKTINNPIQRQYAWLLPPWLIVVHKGRKSGRVYRTPVDAFRKGNTIAIPVLYGERSDWVQNLLAGGGQVVRGGRTYSLRDPRVVAVQDAPSSVSAPARAAGRMSGKLLVAELDGPEGKFGRGPRAG